MRLEEASEQFNRVFRGERAWHADPRPDQAVGRLPEQLMAERAVEVSAKQTATTRVDEDQRIRYQFSAPQPPADVGRRDEGAGIGELEHRSRWPSVRALLGTAVAAEVHELI